VTQDPGPSASHQRPVTRYIPDSFSSHTSPTFLFSLCGGDEAKQRQARRFPPQRTEIYQNTSLLPAREQNLSALAAIEERPFPRGLVFTEMIVRACRDSTVLLIGTVNCDDGGEAKSL
jgi:hypothetical protein